MVRQEQGLSGSGRHHFRPLGKTLSLQGGNGTSNHKVGHGDSSKARRTLILIRGPGKGWLRTQSEPGLKGRGIDLRGEDQKRRGEEA